MSDSERQLNLIAKSIMNAAAVLKSEKQDLTISNIIVRNDSYKTKVNEGNKDLRKMFYERKFSQYTMQKHQGSST